jgi:hypothetical protein
MSAERLYPIIQIVNRDEQDIGPVHDLRGLLFPPATAQQRQRCN